MDDEIIPGWCLGLTWRCTPAESIGLWSVVLFYATLLVATVVHGVAQNYSGTAARNQEATRRHTSSNGGNEVVMLCMIMCYFFSFTAGCLLWVTAGVHWVHPVQIPSVQICGSAILNGCTILFILSHIHLGENWSPEPEQKLRHELVTHGVFRWCRHPMYAVILWAAVGTLLATLNWVIAWCVFGSVLVMLSRIETEERILVELFGGRYLEYRQHVSALGPPWGVLGFDRQMPAGGANYAPPGTTTYGTCS
jgi:protein-S-isoprenylcysteine O-methyltransferase Ste14